MGLFSDGFGILKFFLNGTKQHGGCFVPFVQGVTVYTIACQFAFGINVCSPINHNLVACTWAACLKPVTSVAPLTCLDTLTI